MGLYPIEDMKMDDDGNVSLKENNKTKNSKITGYVLNFLRYSCMVLMYGGACGILYAVGTMIPEELPPYAPTDVKNQIIPISVPQPPNPPTSGTKTAVDVSTQKGSGYGFF